ncbi:MAG: hypothetical protein F4Y38_06650 [Gemmatimonadetes bacterium]|nr:hypothetical protein [Gemmatimonadota bacterium]MYG84444.1 hypothetical protein [Gemmatimonadota bacterium]MYJ88665.1 hypothetical protein [Gemmatimonadota bacterium]
MNIHLKTAAILLATLIIGMVCGALILGAFARDRLQPPPQVTRDRFVERWVRMVRPDPAQLQRIREVVGEHESGFRENYMRHRQEMQDLVDSLHRDLEPILTEEQLERIKRIREERERVLEFRRDGDREPRRGRPGPSGRNRAGERGRGDRTDSNRSEGRGSDDRAEGSGNGSDR